MVFSSAGGGVGDTWEYDVVDSDWRRVRSAVSPVQRGDAGFVYDEGYGVFIMYGGMSDVNPLRVLNETWVYDPVSEALTVMIPEVCTPRTSGCRVVYECVNEVNLLWGGNLPGPVILGQSPFDKLKASKAVFTPDLWRRSSRRAG